MKNLESTTEKYIDCSINEIKESIIRNISYTTNERNISPIEELFIAGFEVIRTIDRIEYKDIDCIYNPEILCESGKKYYPDFTFCYLSVLPDSNFTEYGDLKLLVELDGHIWHEKSAEKVESDKIRERELIKNGYTLLRYSGREVMREPAKVVKECLDEYNKRIFAEGRKEGGQNIGSI